VGGQGGQGGQGYFELGVNILYSIVEGVEGASDPYRFYSQNTLFFFNIGYSYAEFRISVVIIYLI
jgi:hypothetical protein